MAQNEWSRWGRGDSEGYSHDIGAAYARFNASVTRSVRQDRQQTHGANTVPKLTFQPDHSVRVGHESTAVGSAVTIGPSAQVARNQTLSLGMLTEQGATMFGFKMRRAISARAQFLGELVPLLHRNANAMRFEEFIEDNRQQGFVDSYIDTKTRSYGFFEPLPATAAYSDLAFHVQYNRPRHPRTSSSKASITITAVT